jgi:hypothetical protein
MAVAIGVSLFLQLFVPRKSTHGCMQAANTSDNASSSCPILQAFVFLADDNASLVMSPARERFADGVGDVLNCFADACCSVERLLENNDLLSKLDQDSSVDLSASMRDIIVNEQFDDHQIEAELLINQSYARAVERMQGYEKFRCYPMDP